MSDSAAAERAVVLRKWTMVSGAVLFFISCFWGLFSDAPFINNYKVRDIAAM